MVKITGADRVTRRLKTIGSPEMVREVGRAVFAAAEMIVVDAQISITDGAVSGKGHVASLPGQPPNQNLGTLSNNIEAVHDAPLRASAVSRAPYSAALEFGTSRMQARPFMAPAAEKNRKKATDLVARAVSRVIRRAGV